MSGHQRLHRPHRHAGPDVRECRLAGHQEQRVVVPDPRPVAVLRTGFRVRGHSDGRRTVVGAHQTVFLPKGAYIYTHNILLLCTCCRCTRVYTVYQRSGYRWELPLYFTISSVTTRYTERYPESTPIIVHSYNTPHIVNSVLLIHFRSLVQEKIPSLNFCLIK